MQSLVIIVRIKGAKCWEKPAQHLAYVHFLSLVYLLFTLLSRHWQYKRNRVALRAMEDDAVSNIGKRRQRSQRQNFLFHLKSFQDPSVWFLLAMSWSHRKITTGKESKGTVINDLVYHCTDLDHEDQRNIAICLKTHSFTILCYSWITVGTGGVDRDKDSQQGGVVVGRQRFTEVRRGTFLTSCTRGESTETPPTSRAPLAPLEDVTRMVPYLLLGLTCQPPAHSLQPTGASTPP